MALARLACAFAAAALCVRADDEVHVTATDRSDVLVVGDDSFDEALASGPMLLEFYAPVRRLRDVAARVLCHR